MVISDFDPLQTFERLDYRSTMRRLTIMLACALASGVARLCIMIFNLTGDCPQRRCEPTIESVSHLLIGIGFALAASVVVRLIRSRTS